MDIHIGSHICTCNSRRSYYIAIIAKFFKVNRMGGQDRYYLYCITKCLIHFQVCLKLDPHFRNIIFFKFFQDVLDLFYIIPVFCKKKLKNCRTTRKKRLWSSHIFFEIGGFLLDRVYEII